MNVTKSDITKKIMHNTYKFKKNITAQILRQRTDLVVYLSGVQRSGTNSIMEVLEHSSEADVFMEVDRRAYDKYSLKSDIILRQLVANSHFYCVVFKALQEAHDLKRLMKLFENCKLLWVFRDYNDVVNSNLARWPGGRNQIDDILMNNRDGGWRAKGMTHQTRGLLREVYDSQMNDASAQALFWYYRNQLFFDAGFDHDPRVHVIRYESITSDTRCVDSLAAFLGVKINSRMKNHLHPRSINKKSAPVIDGEVKILCTNMLKRLIHVWQAQK